MALVEPREERPVALSADRHRLGVRHELHGASRPHPRRHRAVSARGRRHTAELRVDARAVVALVVVLHDDLPVRRHLVMMCGPQDQLLGSVGADQLIQVSHVLEEGDRGSRWIHEQPAVPFADGRGQQSFVDRIGGGKVLEAGSAAKAAVQRVRPGVIGALQELVPAVTAHVVEAPQLALSVSNQQDPLRSDAHGRLITGLLQDGRPAHAYPGTLEEVGQLPFVYLAGCVGLRGERPGLPDRRQHRQERGRIEWRGPRGLQHGDVDGLAHGIGLVDFLSHRAFPAAFATP